MPDLAPFSGRLALTCLALALGACAAPGPAHTPLATLPAERLGLGAPAPSVAPAAASPWWQLFADPQLDALIAQALREQPDMALGQARMEGAAALARASATALQARGVLAADATRQHYTANGMVPAPLAGHTHDSANLQATLSWSPDWSGKRRAELEAALGQARAAEADRASAAQQLSAQVARSYVALARLLAQRQVAERTLTQREALLSLTQQRTQAGLDSQVELTQAQAALPEVRTQLEMLDEQITLTRHQLAVLCGQPPQAFQGLQPTLEQLHLPAVPQTLGADLLGRRPDVRAARWRIEAATQGVRSAEADFYPDVNLTAFIGLNAIGLDQLLQGSSRQMGITPALRLPLFDGERLRAQLRVRHAEVDAAIAQYNQTVLQAVRQAQEALTSLDSLQRQQHWQQQSLEKAERAYDLAVQRYRAGLASQITVLQTESQLIQQRRLSVDLQARALDGRIQLLTALGGRWADAPLPAATAQVSP